MDWLQLISVLFFALGMAGYPCCCGAVCGCCDGRVKRTVVFTISGVTNNGCSDCTNLNGTFELDYIGSCIWELLLDLEDVECVTDTQAELRLVIQCSGGFQFAEFYVEILTGSGSGFIVGPYDTGANDCNVTDLDVTAGSKFTAGSHCTYTGATILVTM